MGVTKRDVSSLSKSGSAKLKGDVTLSEGSGVTLTQSGQDISIAAAGGGTVDSVVAGTNIDVDATDPANPIVSVEALTAADITDFDTEVSNNTDVAANTLARHAALTVTDSSEIDLALTGQDLTATLKAGSIDETKLDASVNASLDLADSAVQDLADLSITATASELNTLDGITASTAELNILDGVTATAAELNHVDGVTSAIQTQLDGKQPLDSDLTTIAGLTATTNNFMVAVSSAWASRTPAQAAATLQVEMGKLMYPIGCIYFSTNSTNPATSLGFGTWSAFGAGRVPVGFDSGQTEFDTDEETGGAKTHTLTVAEIPAHNHQLKFLANALTPGATGSSPFGGASSSGTNTFDAGGGGAHNNLQPYIVVRMWKRVS